MDYDFLTASSRIVCCIGGHCHIDYMNYSEGGIPIIVVTTDSRQTINEDKAEIGTISEQSISAFVLDYDNNSLYLYRIGRGEDRVVQLPC